MIDTQAERRTVGGIPVFTFEEIGAEFEARGIDIQDFAGSDGHYHRWHCNKGLPQHDTEGKHFGSSKIFYQQYQDDPDGEAACPPYIDFWHELVDVSQSVPWKERPGYREKTVPIASTLWPDIPDATEEELTAARNRMEERIGSPLPDYAWAEMRKEILLRGIRAAKAREITQEILDKHGVEHATFGKVVMIEMKVDC